ncbi:MAG: DUF547 domain-containing protein, partial [Thermovirgaceae bacterium]|nr:DUF547 domain-containing protein [Thermovirgaceae bacterium]
VRIGNRAFHQKQLDIYGEILDAALRLSNYVGKIDLGIWPFLRNMCDAASRQWREKDHGIWEIRGGPHHFVHSKIMCWVALDRGLAIARRYGFPADFEQWERIRDQIREEVLDRGWSEHKRSFVQHYDTDALDASLLLIPFYRFLPYEHPKMVSTVEAVRKELSHQELIYRYQSADGLSGREGCFLVCSFWLVDNLIGQGRLDEAELLLCRLSRTANHLGLFSEEYDPRWKEALGNFPQAFTHIGYVNSFVSLCKARSRADREVPGTSFSQWANRRLLVTGDFVLNEEAPLEKAASGDIARDLKRLMNTLRGGYFRAAQGRVAYEEMSESRTYREYVACSRYLHDFDLALLRTGRERLAFWINLFNVLVIHGVIALGIRDSVREVTRFFRRIRYVINGMVFGADDIEHGVLRGNHRLPLSFFKPFRAGDPRLDHAIEDPDPRIHFALVCASSSCPPIEIYTAENLDEELDVSGRTFLNAGGIHIDRNAAEVHLSKIFKWYGKDFGETEADRLRFISPYLYDEGSRRYLDENADKVRVRYQSYDWRLNRL